MLNLKEMLADAPPMNDDDRRVQRRSYVYGTTKIENDYITRDIVDEVEREMCVEDENCR